MIYKQPSARPHWVRIHFELPSCVWADHIAVVGDFNDWDSNATPMHQEQDGRWAAAIDMPEGCQCEFRYLIDDHWMTDYHADGVSVNAYGTDNSIVIACLPAEALRLERSSSQIWNHEEKMLPFNCYQAGRGQNFLRTSAESLPVQDKKTSTIPGKDIKEQA
jgi:hypothetical protein